MSEPFIAEIRMFGGNFAPRSWAFCDGQLLPISQNTALFSLLGTTYGGDGRTTFGLPNLRDRSAMHPGRGPGLSPRTLGEMGGASAVTLTAAEMPRHGHALRGTASPTSTSPAGHSMAATGNGSPAYRIPGNTVAMAGEALGAAGSGGAHNNRQPVLGISFIIALQGVFPPRS